MSGSIGLSPIALYTSDAANEAAKAAANLKADPQAATLAAYFKKIAPSLTTPAALLANTKALTVLLGAFNLSGSINDTAILKKLLTQDPTSKTSLAQTLGSAKYQIFANALGGWKTQPFATAANVTQIANAYSTNVFEQAANAQAPGLANALYFTREASSLKSVAAVQSDANLLDVAVTGLGLPLQNFEELSFDQQTAILKTKLDLANLQKPSYVKQVSEQYIVAQQSSSSSTPAAGSTASLFSNGTDTTGDSLFSILYPSADTDASSGSASSSVLSLFA